MGAGRADDGDGRSSMTLGPAYRRKEWVPGAPMMEMAAESWWRQTLAFSMAVMGTMAEKKYLSSMPIHLTSFV
jgi:hypothetical protein